MLGIKIIFNLKFRIFLRKYNIFYKYLKHSIEIKSFKYCQILPKSVYSPVSRESKIYYK